MKYTTLITVAVGILSSAVIAAPVAVANPVQVIAATNFEKRMETSNGFLKRSTISFSPTQANTPGTQWWRPSNLFNNAKAKTWDRLPSFQTIKQAPKKFLFAPRIKKTPDGERFDLSRVGKLKEMGVKLWQKGALAVDKVRGAFNAAKLRVMAPRRFKIVRSRGPISSFARAPSSKVR